MKKPMLAALAATLLIAGCQRHRPTTGMLLSPDYTWIYYDGGPADYGVVSANKARTENNLLRVDVQLRNLRRERMRILYKIMWLDAQGFELPSMSDEWTLRLLSDNETIFISGVAPDVRAVDCRVQFKKSER